MDELERPGTEDTVFRDVLMLALAGFVAMVVLLLPHINPPASADAEDRAPGNIIVEIHWPDGLDIDVDLWVRAPGDVPVGYSNKGGRVFNLLRDDLGSINDLAGVNYEFSFSRGAPAGEYAVNVHLFRNNAGRYPVPVTVVVSLKAGPRTGARRILQKRVELARHGEELTVFRFRLDGAPALVPGSVHDLPVALRSGPS